MKFQPPPHKNPCESDTHAGLKQQGIENHKNSQQECVSKTIDALQIRSKKSAREEQCCDRSSTTSIGQQLLCCQHVSISTVPDQGKFRSVVSTLPMTNHQLECQLGLLFEIGAMLFSRYNCINNIQENHMNMNKNNIK
jgi:hypothetical protein